MKSGWYINTGIFIKKYTNTKWCWVTILIIVCFIYWLGITFIFLVGLYIGIGSGFPQLRAYLEMTDRAGARELLQEVLSEGDAAQQQRAQALLDSLS